MKLNNKTGKNLKYSLITREKEGNMEQIITTNTFDYTYIIVM